VIHNIFDADQWAAVPFHFWSAVVFVFGTIVGSFLNVCIHRLPLGQSVVSPPSHCPHCKYSIPWFLNVPLVTWLYLRGRCKNCRAPISIRYFLVELLTGCLFLACWLEFGRESAGLALVYCLFLALLIAATFIDFEHFIIPDEITIGGMIAGVALSLVLPEMHGTVVRWKAGGFSLIGLATGFLVVYSILRLGKLLFGRQRLKVEEPTSIVFTETMLYFQGQELALNEIFYRDTDQIYFHATVLELPDRCYRETSVRLTPLELRIGDDVFNPETIPHLEGITGELVLPREAMGLGDVKFMGAIGAFLGWQSVLFSLMISSVIGSMVGVTLILLGKREWSSRLPYGPYIAIAAAIWLFGGWHLFEWMFPR
jgi:leader peptidase (prepilin peptidase)/N-methyltransferase